MSNGDDGDVSLDVGVFTAVDVDGLWVSWLWWWSSGRRTEDAPGVGEGVGDRVSGLE